MKRIGMLTLILAGVFLAGCSRVQEEEKAAPPAEPIKIGALLSVTGPAAWLGEPERNTAVMIVEEVNAKGGINGRPIQLIVEDTEGDDTKTVTAARKLINRDQVVAIIGPSTSGNSMAVVPIMEEERVPMVSCAAAESIVKPVDQRRYVFKSPQFDSDAVIRIYEHMQSKGINQIGIITATTGFGQAGRSQLKRLADEMGMTILADETYAPNDTDMTAQLTKIKAANAQAVVNWSIEPAQSIVPMNMQQLGMSIPLYQSHGFGNIKYAEAAGEAAEGIIFPAGPLLAVETLPDTHPQKQVLMDYKQAYEARFREAASTFGGHAYDALHLVLEAIKIGGATREGIRDGLEQIQGFVGTAGIFNLSPDDHCGLTKESFEMLTVKNGRFVLLEE